MDESNGSGWAIVIRDNGETKVVPLANMSVLDQGPSSLEDKNSTTIVLPPEEDVHSSCSKSSDVRLNVNMDKESCSDASDVQKHAKDTDSLSTFIGLATGHEDDFTDNELGGAIITIADATEVLPNAELANKVNIDVIPKESWTPVTTAVDVLEDVVVNCDLREPMHSSQSLVKDCDVANTSKPLLCHSNSGVSVEVNLSPHYRLKAPDCDRGGGKVKGGDLKTVSPEEQMKQRDHFSHQVKNWTKRIPALSKGLYEPFERMEATLHKDVISELGISTNSGIFLSLHQQGVARGVRVTETGPNQVVVSGSLVELLASRDLILEEINQIRGGKEKPSSSTPLMTDSRTKEIGVMCDLIPSPPLARYASSLGLDRSARRNHSVLSRPLSPEPRPQRRKSRRHVLPISKEKNSVKPKVLDNISESCKTQSFGQIAIKSESDFGEKLFGVDFANDSNPRIPPLGSVPAPVDSLKIEPGYSDPSLVHNTLPNLELRSLESDKNNFKPTVMLVLKPDTSCGTLAFQKDLIVPLTDERLSCQFKQSREDQETNNKENIHVETVHLKSERLENDLEATEMEHEGSKVLSETKVDLDISEIRHDPKVKSTSVDLKYKFLCNICSYKSMRKNHLEKHMKLHEKGLALYRCAECSFVSIRASHLRRHKMSHAVQVLRCHQCAYTCDDKKLLSKHVRVKHQMPKQQQAVNATNESEAPETFECDDCEYKTSLRYSFQRHRRTHSSSKMVMIHACPECSYKTMRREHFLRHIKNVHQNHRPFLCDICGKAFKRQDALKQHHVTHYQNVGSSSSSQMGPYGFNCKICHKVCRSSAYLKEHMATHSEERSFLCEVCGASFKTRSVQRNHVQTIHRRPRSFTCSACEKRFNTKFALRRHMKQHDLSLDDAKGLQDISSSSRLCNLQHGLEAVSQSNQDSLPISQEGKSIMTSSSTSLPSSQAPPSAYQITIIGQPAFILPDIVPSQSSVDENSASVIGDSNTVIVEGDGTSSAELPQLGRSRHSLPLPVGSNGVHIVDQEPLSSASSDIILSSEQYESSRTSGGTTMTTTPSYGTSEHTNSTLLYLATNF